ncbi:unnamed protein product [Closterium sp. NIES-54]
MATISVLIFYAKGRPIRFDCWLEDLELYLHSKANDDVSLLEHTLGSLPAPLESVDRATHTQWLTHDAAACLPLDERVHFGQLKTAKELYDAIVARYSSPATAALGRLLLPYFFPELSDFHTVAGLFTHLRASDRLPFRSQAGLPRLMSPCTS